MGYKKIPRRLARTHTARERARIRRVMEKRAPHLEYLARLAMSEKDGPDPEAALVFTWMLDQECRAAIKAAEGRRART